MKTMFFRRKRLIGFREWLLILAATSIAFLVSQKMFAGKNFDSIDTLSNFRKQ